METMEAIITRRSIRKYEKKAIEKEKVEQLLKAAMYAPSARNYQPWHYIVIDNREMLDKLAEVHPYGEMLKEAPLGILICGDINLEPTKEYIAVDCSAATQNLLLAAHDLDLGAVWLGVYPREERSKAISELLNLPENIIPVSLISVGYPAEKKAVPKRFRIERIHYNGW